MIQFKPTRNIDLIEAVGNHPDIIAGSNNGDGYDYKPDCRYFEVNVHGQFGGIVYYQEIQPLTFDCHAMYLPEIRGFSKEIGLAFWRYILTNTTVQCVTSFAAYLKGLKNYLQSTQQAAKAAVTTPTGQQTIPFIIGYGTAMNPVTTGAAVSYGLLTRAYESEPFRNAMLRMANTPRGSTAFEKAMQQAQKAINALTQGAKSDSLSE